MSRIRPAAAIILALAACAGCEVEPNDTLAWMESECLDCESYVQKAMCDDGQDNDEDGLADCLDPDCKGIGCCGSLGPEDTDNACADSCDNDGNGYLDCADFSCSKSTTVTVCKSPTRMPEDTPETCSDGIDNDWNGYFDCNDFSCSGAEAVLFCEGNDATCSDGVDNDANGYTDCKDFACSKSTKVTVCK